MYQLIKHTRVREWLVVEGPALAGSICIAEFFYKFHSFTLECLAFLVTWSLVSAALHGLTSLSARRTDTYGGPV